MSPSFSQWWQRVIWTFFLQIQISAVVVNDCRITLWYFINYTCTSRKDFMRTCVTGNDNSPFRVLVFNLMQRYRIFLDSNVPTSFLIYLLNFSQNRKGWLVVVYNTNTIYLSNVPLKYHIPTVFNLGIPFKSWNNSLLLLLHNYSYCYPLLKIAKF